MTATHAYTRRRRMQREIHRGLELVRATESAALTVGRWLGRGDKVGTREGSQQAMSDALEAMTFDGRIVIGVDDPASLLQVGRHVGTGREQLDLALLPVDGISLVTNGFSQALSIAVSTESDGIPAPLPVAYMEKIAVGPQARGAIDILDTPENNLRRIAFAMDMPLQDVTVVMLDRPRHEPLLQRIRDVGVRVALISDGDVGAAMMAAWPGSGIHVLMGSGGTKEAILAACALRCLGGELQCKPWVRHEEEASALRHVNVDPEGVITMHDLVPAADISVAVTGVTGGGLLNGVQYHDWWAESHSLVMRLKSGTIREIRTRHHYASMPENKQRIN